MKKDMYISSILRTALCLLVGSLPFSVALAQEPPQPDGDAPIGKRIMERSESRQQLTILVDGQELSNRINRDWTASRNILETGKDALTSAAKGQLSNAVVTLVAGGVTELFKLTTINKTRREKWLSTVRQRNCWTDSLQNSQSINDFYGKISKLGALDPSDMQFNGFDFVEMDGEDVIYRVHCTIDTSANGLYEIINHGKFLLQLDSLYINPYAGHIPNAGQKSKSYPFEFEQDGDEVQYQFSFAVKSSWMTEAIEYFKDVELGRFSIAVTLNEASLNAEGPSGHRVYSYGKRSRQNPTNVPSIYGESLIVPRSYLGISHNDYGNVDNIWSTGEFDVSLTIHEQRRIGDDYWNSPKGKPKYWKNDYKERMNQKDVTFGKWVSQEFSRIDGQAIITTLITTTASAMINDALGIDGKSGTQVPAGKKSGISSAPAP